MFARVFVQTGFFLPRCRLCGADCELADVGFEVLGQRLSFNLVETLQLQKALESLTSIAGFGVFGIFLVALGLRQCWAFLGRWC